MVNGYITTNVRIPKPVHIALKHRAVEESVSLGEIIRRSLYEQVRTGDKNADPQKKLPTLRDLTDLAEPMGGDLSSSIDQILYGKDNR